MPETSHFYGIHRSCGQCFPIVDEGDFSLGSALFRTYGSYRAFDRETAHQELVLILRKALCLLCVPRPLEPAVRKPFIKEQETVPFPEETLNPVCFGAAEEEKCSFLIRIELKTAAHDCSEAVNPKAEVSPTTSDKDPGWGSVLKHDAQPESPGSSDPPRFLR